MKAITKSFSILIAASFLVNMATFAFVPNLPTSRQAAFSKTRVNIFGEDPDPPKKLTRDNEPEEYFSTNMDKMTDQEKLPVAIAGLAFISLPFILGLIALYSAK